MAHVLGLCGVWRVESANLLNLTGFIFLPVPRSLLLNSLMSPFKVGLPQSSVYLLTEIRGLEKRSPFPLSYLHNWIPGKITFERFQLKSKRHGGGWKIDKDKGKKKLKAVKERMWEEWVEGRKEQDG